MTVMEQIANEQAAALKLVHASGLVATLITCMDENYQRMETLLHDVEGATRAEKFRMAMEFSACYQRYWALHTAMLQAQSFEDIASSEGQTIQ